MQEKRLKLIELLSDQNLSQADWKFDIIYDWEFLLRRCLECLDFFEVKKASSLAQKEQKFKFFCVCKVVQCGTTRVIGAATPCLVLSVIIAANNDIFIV